MRWGQPMRLTAALLVLGVAVAMTGCSSARPTDQGSGSDRVDLAKLATLAHDFPKGFTTHGFELRQEEPQYVDQVGTTVSYGKSFGVAPPQCHALLKPVDGKVGANVTGVRGDGPGPDEQTIFVGANDPVTVPEPIPATGCDRMTFEVDSAMPDGIAERLPAPTIPGATTIGFKVRYGAGMQPEYYYMAILDGHVYVHVDARVSANFPAQPALPDLLTRAVALIRGTVAKVT
jgi:hypothetical protein